MGSLAVELLNEGVEARLLLQHVGRGRFGGVLLQRQMHPLVAAVILWMPGLAALDLDPQPQPPDRQLAESVERVRGGEGHPVICADRLREPIFLKRALEDGEGVALLRRREGFTSRGESGWRSR